MKKLLALSMAAMMALGMTATINAADEGTKDVDTTKTEDTQNGEVWGSVSKEKLKQLKVTMPIKIEFIISPGEPDAANTMTVGDYKVIVPNDSQVGVQVTSIKATPSLDTVWHLSDDASVVTDDVFAYSLKIADTVIKEGDNAIASFQVTKNSQKSLGITGSGSKKEIADKHAASKALDIVYTIKQYTAPADAA